MSAGAQAERRESSPLSDRDFARVRAFLKERTGIHLADAKKRLVLTRLAPRLRLTGSRSMSDYLDPLTGSREKPEPPVSHEWKVRPTGDADKDGWIPYEVYTDADGVISEGKVKA